MMDFEKNHPGIAQQELWKLFVRKAEEAELGRYFISAVGEVCAIGLDLSKYIVRFFPTFTLHDETHSAKVCRWMWVLLGEEGRKKLTPHEAALLLMAACCHDIGMAVSPEQEERMRLRTYPGWDDYFRQNLKDDTEYCRTGVISDRMLRKFVRMHHHERIGENLRQSDWPDTLLLEELDWELLLKLCRSHGSELTDAELNYREGLYDLRMCAVVLRLADLLDFDAGRAPETLFRQMGLDRPRDAESWRSAEEYQKNRAGNFREKFVSGRIPYVAAYNNPGVEQEIRKYLDWVDSELANCRNCLSQSASYWKCLDLPYRVDDEKVQRKGYAAGKFCMTMDQDKILDLLTGENLYSDAGVFVRELLQNSIDAVLMRAKQDPNFSLEDGLIQIDTWMDKEANTWFRIRDNGTGMNERIIQNHFLKVGNSYYTSEDFQYDNRLAPKGSYTAISRFGIGILSCFMGDKEHTQLKVSTKRFDEGPKSGIRLDVTGLHGYYFLCNEKDHPEYEDWFPQMPSNDAEDRGYRREPGTTICVNVNLLRAGDLRSVREVLDKYVQFPEIRVTYNGPDGYHEYPTQQELMDAVYALNPDGVVKEYVHEIPDDENKEIMKWFSKDVKRNKAKVKILYMPVNWASDSEKLTGVVIRISIYIDDQKPYMNTVVNHDSILLGTSSVRFSGAQKGKSELVLMTAGGNSILSVEEQKVWDMCWVDVYSAEYKKCQISHNGVGGMSLDWYYHVADEQIGLVLLREDFLPKVNMARDTIEAFSTEAEYCFSRIPYLRLDLEREILPLNVLLATEKELWEILDRHSWWQEELERHSSHDVNDVWKLEGEIITHDYKMWRLLWMAYWKRKRTVWLFGSQLLTEVEDAADEKTADFPAGMFVRMSSGLLAVQCSGVWPLMYNRMHPFSQWLINNWTLLIDQVPVIYDKLIRTMMLSYHENEIHSILNSTLTALKNYPGNPFRVPTDLVLTQADFETRN